MGLFGGGDSGGGGGILGILSKLTDPLGLFGGKGGGSQQPGQPGAGGPMARPTPMTGQMIGTAAQPGQPVPFVGPKQMGGGAGNAGALQALLAMLQRGG